MFSIRLPSPPTRREFGQKSREVFEVKGYHKIYVSGEPAEIDEAEEGDRPDDNDFGGELPGDNMQLREILQLLCCKHVDLRQKLSSKFSRGLVRPGVFTAQEFSVDEPRRCEQTMLPLLPEHNLPNARKIVTGPSRSGSNRSCCATARVDGLRNSATSGPR